jgi:DME family drug/metabolite transporter
MASTRSSSARIGLLQVCVAGVLWGTGGLVLTALHERDGLGAMTVATLVEPLSAALLAAVLLDERLPWPALVGGVLILAAVVALHPTEEQPAPA